MSPAELAFPCRGKLTQKTQDQPPTQHKTDQPSPKVQSIHSSDSACPEFCASPSLPTETKEPQSLILSKKRKGMEGSPFIPQRSVLRTSRFLDDIISMTKSEDGHTPSLPQSLPHDVYLSSEEEASSSADDFSDYDFEEDHDPSCQKLSKSPTRRNSHEDTARVVSVIFSGRPSIIEVATPKRSPSQVSVISRPRTSAANTSYSFSTHRPSTSASHLPNSSFHTSRSSSTMLPPTSKVDKHRPQFLSMDPFPSRGGFANRQSLADDDFPRTPKSPAAVFRSVSRTISLVKKRSRSVVGSGSVERPEFHNSSVDLRMERSQTPQSLSSMLEEEPVSRPTSGEFVLHSDLVAPRGSPMAFPPQPRTASGTVKTILAMARRRSIHVRASARV